MTRLLPASAMSRSVPTRATADGKDIVLAEGDGLPLLAARHAAPGLAGQLLACPMMAVACGENGVVWFCHRGKGGKSIIRLLRESTTAMPWLLGSTTMPCGLTITVLSVCDCDSAVPLADCCTTPMIRVADREGPGTRDEAVKTRTRPSMVLFATLRSLSDTYRFPAPSKAIPSGTANWLV